MTRPVFAALRIAAEGHRVFPCTERKVPLVEWRAEASDRAEVIEAWWSRWPDALIGHPTGMKSSSRGAWCEVVLDIDVKDGATGPETLAMMEQQLGFLPETCTSITRSGGQHRWFWTSSEVRNSQGKIGVIEASGIDVRGEGGYVVAPPSPGYEWCGDSWLTPDGDVRLAELPAAWVEAIVAKAKPVGTPRPLTVEVHLPGRRAYTDKALDAELRTLAATPQGERNGQLFKAAASLGGLVLAGALSRDGVAAALDMVCATWTDRDERKDRATIQRGLAAAQPRTIPERGRR
jgi:hypothetical protein